MDEQLRRRYAPFSESEVDPRNITEHQEQSAFNNVNHHSNRRDRPTRPRAAVSYVIIGTFYLLIGICVHRRLNSYPIPKTAENSYPFEFREESARKHLDILTGFGPRVSGSEANEKAKEYIVETIKTIISGKINNMSMIIDLQKASGSFVLDFVGNGVGQFSSVYQDLNNIVVKVSPQQESESSVLINCHYDTVVDSPGAGDDAASCCVMLEILRVLSQTHQPDLYLMHNIIFLFNSAEENILQTSHAFITQHKWAPSVKAFVNLDSAGAGGWEIVFQTGPEHPWLIKAYIESAPYPHASVLGQEVFQTGLIPSDTDFRIFRDYGAIPGIDIAHIKNGYVYHTRNDVPSYIAAGSIQRGGENVLATVKNMASSHKLTDPGADKHGSLVFFDFLGYFMVSYPYRMSIILNWSTFVYVVAAYLKNIFKDRTDYGTKIKQLMLAALTMMATWGIILLAPLAMASFLSTIGRSLSYYSYNLNVVWLFMLPSSTAAIALNLVFKRTVFKNWDPETVVLLLQDVNLMLWSLVMAVMTMKGLMSSFLPLMFILCPVCVYTVLQLLGLKPTNVALCLLASFVPSLYIVGMSYTLLMLLIPIMGRSGMENNPDMLIAFVSALPVMICLPYQIGFVYTNSKVGRVVSTTTVVIGLALASVIITPAGFPYSANQQDVSVQRGIIVHIDRRFHSYTTGEVTRRNAHLWYKPIDYLGGKVLMQYAPWLLETATKATCDGVYCGRPYLFPVLPHVDARKTYDFPAPELNLTRVNVELIERVHLNDSMTRLKFSMSGPSHVTIFISEMHKAKIKYWDFGHFVPVEAFTLPSIRYPTYFVYYAHAGPPGTTWLFSMDVDLDCTETANHSLIRIGFAGHHLHGPTQLTPDLLRLEQELPSWMVTMRWSATYDEFVF